MAISVNQLLEKIEGELHKAKSAGSSTKLRESVHTIKILCELILEDNGTEAVQSIEAVPALQRTSQALSPTTLVSKKLDEQEANGDSLFDF